MKEVSKILIVFMLLLFSNSDAHSFEPTKILFLGDSLTEGYRLPKTESFPSLIEAKFKEEFGDKKFGQNLFVLNGGVSGSTTASGLSRLRWFMKAKPSVLVLALGANDGLRGFSLEASYKNLREIILYGKKKKLKILLCGMKMPPNYGEKYRKGFVEIYKKLKNEFKLPFYPFLLKGVAGKPELNLEDGIHPNKQGYEVIAKNLYEFIKKEIL